MKGLIVLVVIVAFAHATPPSSNQGGWGQQQQQQQPQQQGWGQQGQQQQSQVSGGYGQAQAQPQQMGWGQPQMQQMSQGWGGQSSSGSGQKGKKGIDWEYNFALGYQGDKGKGGSGGWGQQEMVVQEQQSGWGSSASSAPAMSGGWSSEPETNIKKPSIGEIFSAILSFPKEIKMLFKESGLWILLLPLLIIVPLFLLAFSAGKFYGGMSDGWGWEEKRSGKAWLETEWDRLQGFIKDPRVQKAAKGFMDEFVANRIVTSVHEEVNAVKDKKNAKSKPKRR